MKTGITSTQRRNDQQYSPLQGFWEVELKMWLKLSLRGDFFLG
jgi:hypothetical protein